MIKKRSQIARLSSEREIIMPNSISTPGVLPGRLEQSDLTENFADLHKPLSYHEASVAADRCYFCYDAPCITACPTEIDIPLFIRQIQTDTSDAAAKTIFEQNILGGMCARVCPTETLCEEACVREAAEGKPVEIGRLQRFATDSLMKSGIHPFTRADDTGKNIAIIGAGPAGLACAHRLAMYGHNIIIYDSQNKAGGLNEFGIAAYKTTDDFAASEIDWLLKIGGIEIKLGYEFGKDLQLEQLKKEFDAVFLGIGLSAVNKLEAEGDSLPEVTNAVKFIAELRQSSDLSELPVGRNVVVIGGGMTAIDAAVQSKLLGADSVTLAYRRSKEKMGASVYEQELATSKGVVIRDNLRPVKIHGTSTVTEVEFEKTVQGEEGLISTGELVKMPADQVFRAIGQNLMFENDALKLESNRIVVSDLGRTSIDRVWAGGDCVGFGEDLTVTAVSQGRDAAEDINNSLAR